MTQKQHRENQACIIVYTNILTKQPTRTHIHQELTILRFSPDHLALLDTNNSIIAIYHNQTIYEIGGLTEFYTMPSTEYRYALFVRWLYDNGYMIQTFYTYTREEGEQ